MITYSKIKKLPDSPGVYIFKNSRGKILYIGKATSLKNRVRSYLAPNLIETRGPLIVKMLELASKVDFIVTDSVLEALILEVSLIKKHQPYHNTQEKDDKSHNFVLITDEDFPQILTIRGREVAKNYNDPKSYKALYGPFPQGNSLRIALKIVRRIFPYRDSKCTPADKTSALKVNRPCFNRQIGLCPGVCTGDISKSEYARTIKHLMMFFEGKKAALIKSLERDMKSYAKSKEFEKAAAVKKTVFALRHIQDVALMGREDETGGQNKNRIEAYDIAHLAGAATVGVMTVVSHGEPEKAEYRMFKIRHTDKGDDIQSLMEVLNRRFGHLEWTMPDLIVIDGGETHLKHAEETLKNLKIEIPVVSVVKDDKHRPKDILSSDGGQKSAGQKTAILLANAEAHRFAIKQHKNLRNKDFFNTFTKDSK